MSRSDPHGPQLEQLIDRWLRDLPSRRAPATLESRVLAELARCAALPWWQRSFAHWPHMVRVVFVILCLALGALTFIRSTALVSSIESAHLLRPAGAFAGAMVQTAASLVHAIPTQWLYGALAMAATLYGLLFALGAAAYRTLYLDSH